MVIPMQPWSIAHPFWCLRLDNIWLQRPKFLLQRLTKLASYKYNFYMSDGAVYLASANIIEAMKRLQAYKFRIEPNGEQRRALRRIAGTCRFV